MANDEKLIFEETFFTTFIWAGLRRDDAPLSFYVFMASVTFEIKNNDRFNSRHTGLRVLLRIG